MVISGIYKIQSIVKPEKVYIGSAASFSVRKASHLRELRNGIHINGRLQNHCNKYGIEDLVFSIIEECEISCLLNREQYYIDTLNPFFNICRTAGSVLGIKKSEESKRRQSELYRGVNHPCYGRHISDEQKIRQSIIMTGREPWNKGLKLSPEICKINSECHKGLKASDETRAKMSIQRSGEKNPMYGKTHTEETKNKIRESNSGENSWNYGKHLSEESKKKLSESKKGKKMKPLSDEHRRKVSESLIGNKRCVGRIPWNKGKKICNGKIIEQKELELVLE